MTNAISGFDTTLDTINSATKWQDKVSAFQSFLDVVKKDHSIASNYTEAVVCYALIFTNNCSASNVNILRAGLECLVWIISNIGVGPRCAGSLIPCLMNKVVALLWNDA